MSTLSLGRHSALGWIICAIGPAAVSTLVQKSGINLRFTLSQKVASLQRYETCTVSHFTSPI